MPRSKRSAASTPGLTPARSAHGTLSTLPLETRGRIAALLDPALCDSIHLYTQLKHAHWNVSGPGFIALHELFDAIAEEAEEWGDLIAERLRQCGFVARGDAKEIAPRSSLPAYPADAAGPDAHVNAVAARLAAYAEHVRGAIDSADAAGDKATADILTEVARAADKALWLVESNLGRAIRDRGS